MTISPDTGTQHNGKANGAEVVTDSGTKYPVINDAVLDDIDAASSIPNIDGRESVLKELPEDIFVNERDIAIREEEASEDIMFNKPGPQDIARCHPDASRKKVVKAIRDNRNNRGRLYIVRESLLAQHPRLIPMCKLFVVRQFVTDQGAHGLWPAPLPGVREAPSDAKHLEAQEAAIECWVRLEWVNTKGGGRYKFYRIEGEDAEDLGMPQFPDEPFAEILRRGLAPWIIQDREHSLCKHLLRGIPADELNEARL